jgi:DNA-directed RNA polymerase specialized sigma subunit
MTVKAFFRQCRREIAEYQYMKERLDWLRSSLLPEAIRYKQVDVQTSGAGDRMAEVVPEIVGLEHTIAEYVEQLASHQREAEKIISQIEDPEYRLLLWLYYLHDPQMTWEQVADKMHVTERTVYRMHGKALVAANNVIECH